MDQRKELPGFLRSKLYALGAGQSQELFCSGALHCRLQHFLPVGGYAFKQLLQVHCPCLL
jgi:hypothetical protein